jgi:hypothetical protein
MIQFESNGKTMRLEKKSESFNFKVLETIICVFLILPLAVNMVAFIISRIMKHVIIGQ